MRKCKICDDKHHAKGFCKKHYRELVLKPRKQNQKCSVEKCNNSVGNNGYNGLCSKHYTRLKRHGDVNSTTRFREYFSLTEFINNSEQKELLQHLFKNRTQWSLAAKLYYGDKCFQCGWNEVTCDVHHIIPVSNGGLNTLKNAKVICPNCHAKEHRNKPIDKRKYISRL